MSSRLIDDPDGVSALAAQVSDRLGIPAEHVEKDFWVTEVLRGAVHGAAQAGVVVVFKGGTSLSKAFGLIQRFSEDVDMLVIYPEEMRTPDRERALKTIVRGASDATALDTVSVPGATSKGKRRGARFNVATPTQGPDFQRASSWNLDRVAARCRRPSRRFAH